MARGRKQIPKEIKKLKGTFRPGRENKNEPNIGAISRNPPELLDERAINEWNYYIDLLDGIGVLKATDADMLAMMCNDMKDYKRYCVKIKAQGEIVKGKLSPFIRLKNEARKRFLEIAPLFGIDPVNRQKIVVEAEKGKSGLEQIMDMH
jgi:P27 family predicted phage terminase small subunit